MIIAKFAKYLQSKRNDIENNKPCLKILTEWIISILKKEAHTNVEKIIHTEIAYATNEYEDFLLVAKSPSGQVLIEALYNFALSYEHHVLKNWLEDKTPKDFYDSAGFSDSSEA